ncbi:MAG TPA: hypothetical protein VFB76_08595 [Candidatus Angelobacter sp.]|nr:hypothetical protein [Candidatus Angelobacter sp.]
MKLFRYLLGCCLFLAALSSAAEVRIREIGLQGYIDFSGRPQQLRIEVSNPSAEPESYVLHISQKYSGHEKSVLDYKVDLQGHESRLLALALMFVSDGKLTIEQRASNGTVISKDEQNTPTAPLDLVAVVCATQEICSAVSDAIRSAATVEERNIKERQLKILLLTEPPQNWFAYTPVHTLIVAGPVKDQAARDAIENFTRFGGHLIIAADQAPRDFLAPYRVADLREVGVGRGTLRLVNSATGPQLRQLFSPEENTHTPDTTDLVNLVFSKEIDSGTLLQWVGKQFVFPRLRWMIGWMLVYILLIGLLNFFILRRIGRVELGWLTVPTIAIVFAALFYFMGGRGKMTHFTLDQATVCYMDDKSPVGVAEHNFRVASPQVRDLVFQVPSSAVVSSAGQDALFRASDVAAGIWDDDNRQRTKIPEMFVDSAQHVPLEMLRLSFHDLEFRSVHQFTGTVTMKDGILINNTGQDFSQAALVDFRSRKFYELGPLPAGNKIQPFSRPTQDLSHSNRLQSFSPDYHMQGAFTLRGFLESEAFSSSLSTRRLMFIGFTTRPLLTGQLEGVTPDAKTYTLFEVTMENDQ